MWHDMSATMWQHDSMWHVMSATMEHVMLAPRIYQ